jgi:hypothetical protein
MGGRDRITIILLGFSGLSWEMIKTGFSEKSILIDPTALTRLLPHHKYRARRCTSPLLSVGSPVKPYIVCVVPTPLIGAPYAA